MAEYPRCPNCGNNVVESWRWCRHCGYDPFTPAGAPTGGPTGGAGGAGGSSGQGGPTAGAAGGPAYGGGYGSYPGGGSGGGGYGAGGYGGGAGAAGPAGAPPGYGAPGYGNPAYGPPGYGNAPYAPPGYGPTGSAPPRSSAAVVIGIVVVVALLIPVFLIAAVTLLGRNASVKFSSVGPAIDPVTSYPTTVYAPTTPVPGAPTTPPTTAGRKVLPDWTDVAAPDGTWRIAFPNPYVEDGAPVGPFGATGVIAAKSAQLREARPAERLELFVLDTKGVTQAAFLAQVQADMRTKLGYPALASKDVRIDGREAVWYEPNVQEQLVGRFTSVVAVHAGDVSYVLVSAKGSGTAGQDDLLQQFATSLDIT